MISKWKVLSEKNVSPSKWFPVLQHSVELGSKTVIDDFFIAPFGHVAMILPFTRSNEIVLVKQYKHGAGEILIELPAGFQQPGKSIEESALAELEEETGIRSTKENLVSLGKMANNPTKTLHITHGFLVRDVEFNSTQKTEITEEIELVAVPAKKVPAMVASGEIWVADSVAFILKAHSLFPELFH